MIQIPIESANRVFLLFLLFFTHSSIGQSQVIDEISSTNFLDLEEGQKGILDETSEIYFSKLEKREIFVITGTNVDSLSLSDARDFTRNLFSSSVTDFSKEEVDALTFVTSAIKKKFSQNGHTVIANHPWSFIKITNGLCGNFAHTRAEHIVLSDKHTNKIVTTWKSCTTANDTLQFIRKVGGLLIHEQFHCLQRHYPEKFDSLYINEWGFLKGKVIGCNWLTKNQLTNPDAPNAEWVIQFENQMYWARTIINDTVKQPKMGKDFVDIAFRIVENNNKYKVKNDHNGMPEYIKLIELEKYFDSYPVSMGLDHPNEISAYMISDYFESLLLGEVPFKNVTDKQLIYSQSFLLWLNESFKFDR